ncbi:MAG: Gfo/Idh/MocA family oxidoreductase [Deltaproteobacteria bacterium]|nr:Gfo/Idh/MocA family oxidoreductase [Deltaproteobacteria bacterium]MBT5486847.1 Gfo/Idh/MocA family oxidoreductase [Deltaproteobacteria bacterium]
MLRIGIVGWGFMGKMHFRCYKSDANVEVTAICDADAKKLQNSSGVSGNISGAEDDLDLSNIVLYSDLSKMLAEKKIDALSIASPTFLHASQTIEALNEGVHVFCEKPMALNSGDCREMTEVAKQSGKTLQIGHCIRFWPEYVQAKEIIDSQKYGKVLAATFQRLSLTPTWSWDNFFLDGKRSGGAMLDLHIHDTDYVQYVFGMPKEVFSRGVIGPSGEYDHTVTQYLYGNDSVITAEGGWIMAPGFGFEMSFKIMLEKVTLVYSSAQEPTFRIFPIDGETIIPEIPTGDGYSFEIQHFVDTLSGKAVPSIITPEQSGDSVKIIEAEKESIRNNDKISLL